MKINLHKNARTTPAQRLFIQNNSHLNTSQLALKLGVSETTIRKWKNRASVFDRPHAPKTIRTALGKKNEILAVLIRICLHAGLDDLHAMISTFLKTSCSRSTLNRCLNRYQISRLHSLKKKLPNSYAYHKGACLNYTRILYFFGKNNSRHLCCHVAMDIHSRWVYITHAYSDAPEDIICFLNHVFSVFPVKVGAILSPGDIIFQNPIPKPFDHSLECLKAFCQKNELHFNSTHDEYVKTKTVLANAYLSIPPNPGEPGVAPVDFYTPVFQRMLNDYNCRFQQKAIKNLTPTQYLNQRFKKYPASFICRPKQSCDTGPL